MVAKSRTQVRTQLRTHETPRISTTDQSKEAQAQVYAPPAHVMWGDRPDGSRVGRGVIRAGDAAKVRADEVIISYGK